MPNIFFDVTATTAIDTVNNKVTIAYNKFVADGEIHFTNDGSEPSLKSELYKSPVAINSTSSFKAALFRNGEKGNTLTKKYTIHHATGLPYTLTNKWKQYDGGTTYGLTDGIIGEFKKYNTWVGFSGKDLEAVIDLKKAQAIKKISINFYDFNAAWIFLPQYVEILGSSDGVNFTPLKKENINKGSEVNSIVNFSAALNADLRFLKVFAKALANAPTAHSVMGRMPGCLWMK
ncbi:MAG: chitobiase/beta-hexosaminidase C-terminal domain-containing protein [Bacteroidetes bacterium]|nr:chitobiase/beta-hexosaminidase C-terminal domain-containing protein [Bacteroidota bacterium]